MNRYSKDEKILGSGSYGDVYKGTDNLTKEKVALKKMRLEVSFIINLKIIIFIKAS